MHTRVAGYHEQLKNTIPYAKGHSTVKEAMYGDPHWSPGPVRAISIPIQPVRWLFQSP